MACATKVSRRNGMIKECLLEVVVRKTTSQSNLSENMLELEMVVDDMPNASKSKLEIDKSNSQLSREFGMKDMGTVKKILGKDIRIEKVDRPMVLCLKSYMERSIARFIQSAKAMVTPLAL